MISEEISRRKVQAVQAVQELLQGINMVDGKFEGRVNEIKALEMKLEKIKEELAKNQDRANKILQDAAEQASMTTKQAKQLLDEAYQAKQDAKVEADLGRALKAEGQSLMNQALQRQKEADYQFKIIEDRKKKIEEAIR